MSGRPSGGRRGREHDAPLVDAEARRRAVTDFTGPLCVEAGAGTGKTKLLVDRYLEIILSGRARCGQVVAITFTERAAGEMKLRLRGEIEERLGRPTLGEAERLRLTAARDEIERAPISTIHSFASAILREHPIEAGIDPAFTQLDELEASLFIEECWESFLEEASSSYALLFERLARFGVGHDHVRDVVLRAYDRRGERAVELLLGGAAPAGSGGGAVAHRGGPAAGAGATGRGEAAARSPAAVLGDFSGLVELRDAVIEKVGILGALADDHCIDGEDLGRRVIGELRKAIAGIADLEGTELEDLLIAVPLPRLNAGNKNNWRPAERCAEQKGILRELRALLEEHRGRVADRVRDAMWNLIDDFLAFVDGRKAEGGLVDFDDLLIRTRVLLRDEEAVRLLRGRYRFLLVDEFQDTDPLQAEIVLLLAGLGNGGGLGNTAGPGNGGAPGEVEPGRLFIVGDPKQSIYRFRKADVEVYEEIKERIARSGARLSITQNFRSVPGIVQWVNGAFASIIREPAEGRYQPPYEPIHPRRTGGGASLIVLDLELGAEPVSADEVRAREGEGIARAIRRLVSEHEPVGDERLGTRHPLSYGDIAILYPGTTGIDRYEDPLRAEGIPYVVEGGKLYYARQEVRDLAAALWSIEDPYDPLSLVAALRSPLFGMSDEELFLGVRSGVSLNYLEASPEGAAAPDLGAAFALLERLHRLRNEWGPVRVIGELLDRTKYRELSLLRPHGGQRVQNIEKALRIARAFEAGGHSYRRFAEWFRRQDVLGAAEGESPLLGEGEDAVRLSTIHRAKGLQFPVVFLANLIQRRSRSESIILERGPRLAFKLGGRLVSGDFEQLREYCREREEAETARLLYVAATRAGDTLVIPRTTRGGSYFELLEPHLPGGEPTESGAAAVWRYSELPAPRRAPEPFVRLPRMTARYRRRAIERREEWIAARSALIERSARRPSVVTPSGAESAAGAGAAEHAAGPPGGREAAMRFGSAFHRLMEIVDLSGVVDGDTLAASIASEAGIPEQAAELGRLLRRTLESAPLREASRAGRILREVPFTLPLAPPASAARPAQEDPHDGDAVEGRIDLLFERDGAWTALDYKTDDVAPEKVEERFAAYRGQGMLYALALERLGISLGGGVVFYFVRADRAVRFPVDDALLRSAEELIGSLVRTVRDSERGGGEETADGGVRDRDAESR